jgi:DNA-binding NarL/FixJ family response regulator
MPTKRIRIAIVEDQQLMAEALALWLKQEPSHILVGCAANGEAGWQLCRNTRPDLALVDIELPGLDGLKLAERLLVELPELRLLVMSGLSDPHTIWRVGQIGVHGYINKTQAASQLLEAVRAVMSGGTFFSPIFQEVKQQWLAQPEAFQKILSDREQDVLRLVVLGKDDPGIAAKLGISTATVAVHRKNIRRKLSLHSDRDLINYARQWGLDKLPA